MRNSIVEFVGDKVATVGALGLVSWTAWVFDGSNLPFFNVPITTLGMAAFGSILGFAYGTPVTPRKRLYGYGVGGTFIGVWAVVILPSWLGWKWYDAAMMQGALAGAVALISRFTVPVIIDGLSILVNRLLNRTPPGDNSK